MELLERASELELLHTAAAGIEAGEGRVVAVSGESGAGKSVLVRGACRDLVQFRVAYGACDPLSTPRPLGPLRDILAGLGRTAPEPTERAALHGFGEHLRAALATEPTVAIVEDVQWIDEASVDVIRFLVRRIEPLPVLLVLTYRDDELAIGHPARPLLGDIARLEHARSIRLAPLTLDAVRTLVTGTSHDPAAVHELTGGNPFFVAEVADHPDDGLPPTVRDAVLAGTSAVDADDFDVLQLVATAPDGLDDRLLPLLGIDLPTLRRLDATGLLVRSGRGLGFRHELARLAVESAIPPGGAARLHARLLDGLEALGSHEPAVLVHHAVGARDRHRTARHAREAAAEAVRTGSHTEAVAFLELAIEHLDGDDAERAALLQQLSFEQYMVHRLPDAIASITAATELWSGLGEPARLSAAHDRRAVYEYYAGNYRRAEHHTQRAAEVAADGGTDLGFGMARATTGYLAFRHNDLALAARCDREALGVAERLGHDGLRLRCQIIDRATDVVVGRAAARQELLDLVDEAVDRSFDEIASMGWSNLVSVDVEQRRHHAAEQLLDRSLPFTVEHDIAICNSWQTAVRARLHLARGRWEAALEDAHAVLDGGGAPLSRIWPHLVVGLIALRRGEDEGDHLAAAWALAVQLDEPLGRLPVLSAHAERAWLRGEHDERVADVAGDLGGVPALEWAVGDLAVWLDRLGIPFDRSVEAAPPFRLALDGRTEDAASWWRDAGAPFDEALACVAARDEEARRAGIELLDGLGAVATADRCRRELREQGIANLPARPRRSTRSNPAGLTNRQLEVARLVAAGLTNAELAERLFISTKTADHHVSAVLAKLGLSSRRDVVRHASALAID